MTDAVQAPTDIALTTESGISFTWPDGSKSEIGSYELRLRCPCAMCVDEWTGERRLDPATIQADVHPINMEIQGHYALRITWSDNHDTGLYTWKVLKQFGEDRNQTGEIL